jgi:hypothetical protein
MDLPPELNRTIDYAFPDSLWVAAEKHSEDAYTVWVLDLDYRYNECRACLSLDDRWTLSPVRGPWHTYETGSRAEEKLWQRTDLLANL